MRKTLSVHNYKRAYSVEEVILQTHFHIFLMKINYLYYRSNFSFVFRERRNFAELKTIEYATRIALQERFRNCTRIGCGLVDIVAR